MKKIHNNIVLFEYLKERSETQEAQANECADISHNVGICRIVYKDIIINFWHKNHAYTCNVERGN